MTSEAAGRRIVAQRSAGRCERCGLPGPTTVHHRVKRRRGGTWAPANLLALCGDGTTGCHGWVEAHPLNAQAHGLDLPTGTDPTTAEAYLWTVNGAAWWLLTDDGGYAEAPE
jgi:hypothetical protein